MLDQVCGASGFGLGAVLIQALKVGLLLSGLGTRCLLSKSITSLSKSCLLLLKHRKPSGTMLMAYPLPWSLIPTALQLTFN